MLSDLERRVKILQCLSTSLTKIHKFSQGNGRWRLLVMCHESGMYMMTSFGTKSSNLAHFARLISWTLS